MWDWDRRMSSTAPARASGRISSRQVTFSRTILSSRIPYCAPCCSSMIRPTHWLFAPRWSSILKSHPPWPCSWPRGPMGRRLASGIPPSCRALNGHFWERKCRRFSDVMVANRGLAGRFYWSGGRRMLGIMGRRLWPKRWRGKEYGEVNGFDHEVFNDSASDHFNPYFKTTIMTLQFWND